jgi:predicted nucleic acid-binding protein
VKKKSLLDSFAILAWIQDEKGAQRVEDLLYLAQDHKEELLMNIVNLGEVFYRCARVRDIPFARDILEKLRLLPIKIYPCPNDLVLEASEIKAKYPIAYADAFAAATALREGARVVTGDPDFRLLDPIIEIEWVR